MNAYSSLRISREAILLVLEISGPPILAALVIGLLISLLQAATQLQEQTLTIVPKLLAVYVTLLFLGSHFLARVLDFARASLARLQDIVH